VLLKKDGWKAMKSVPPCGRDRVKTWVRRITLKAFANSSPGFALKPWVKKPAIDFFATLKEL